MAGIRVLKTTLTIVPQVDGQWHWLVRVQYEWTPNFVQTYEKGFGDVRTKARAERLARTALDEFMVYVDRMNNEAIREEVDLAQVHPRGESA